MMEALPEPTPATKPTVNHFFFAFNNPSYYPGKPVDGVIVLVIHTPIRIAKIGVTFKGTEFVSWYQGVSQQEHCTATNSIFETTSTVWPKDGEEQAEPLAPGTYTYPFSWQLPLNSPANFEETAFHTRDVIPLVFSASGMPRSFGEVPSSIRYTSTAFVDFSFLPQGDKEPPKLRMVRENSFRVVEAFDPKIIIQPPIVKKSSFQFWLGGNPLDLCLSIANGGVLFSGQNLYVNLSATNKSSRTVDSITFILVEYLTLTAPNPEGQAQSFERRREVLHADVADSQISAGGQYQQDLMFAVPQGTPPTILTSKCIKRTFELVCQVTVSFGSSSQINVPIQILDWSPLLKDDLPKNVPISIRAEKKEQV